MRPKDILRNKSEFKVKSNEMIETHNKHRVMHEMLQIDLKVHIAQNHVQSIAATNFMPQLCYKRAPQGWRLCKWDYQNPE